MTDNGDPYENAIAERVNGILKEEFYLGEAFGSYAEAECHIGQSISTYNSMRPHLSCNFMTPEIAHTQQQLHPKRWVRTHANTKGPSVHPTGPTTPP